VRGQRVGDHQPATPVLGLQFEDLVPEELTLLAARTFKIGSGTLITAYEFVLAQFSEVLGHGRGRYRPPPIYVGRSHGCGFTRPRRLRAPLPDCGLLAADAS
jgi:hypothetical protein